jgi:hypothetical protein
VRTAVHAALSLIDPRPNVYGPGIHRRPCPLSNGALTIRTMSCSCTYCSLDLAWGSSVTRRPSFVMYPNAGKSAAPISRIAGDASSANSSPTGWSMTLEVSGGRVMWRHSCSSDLRSSASQRTATCKLKPRMFACTRRCQSEPRADIQIRDKQIDDQRWCGPARERDGSHGCRHVAHVAVCANNPAHRFAD